MSVISTWSRFYNNLDVLLSKVHKTYFETVRKKKGRNCTMLQQNCVAKELK